MPYSSITKDDQPDDLKVFACSCSTVHTYGGGDVRCNCGLEYNSWGQQLREGFIRRIYELVGMPEPALLAAAGDNPLLLDLLKRWKTIHGTVETLHNELPTLQP